MSPHCMAAGVGVAKTDMDRTGSASIVGVGPHCQQVSPCSRCRDGPQASLILCAAGGGPRSHTGKGYSNVAGRVPRAAGRARTPIKSRRQEAPRELCSAYSAECFRLKAAPCGPVAGELLWKTPSPTCDTVTSYLLRGCNRSHPEPHSQKQPVVSTMLWAFHAHTLRCKRNSTPHAYHTH